MFNFKRENRFNSLSVCIKKLKIKYIRCKYIVNIIQAKTGHFLTI